MESFVLVKQGFVMERVQKIIQLTMEFTRYSVTGGLLSKWEE